MQCHAMQGFFASLAGHIKEALASYLQNAKTT
jgi:hypothetical protein